MTKEIWEKEAIYCGTKYSCNLNNLSCEFNVANMGGRDVVAYSSFEKEGKISTKKRNKDLNSLDLVINKVVELAKNGADDVTHKVILRTTGTNRLSHIEEYLSEQGYDLTLNGATDIQGEESLRVFTREYLNNISENRASNYLANV
jgi:hypothetical protein